MYKIATDLAQRRARQLWLADLAPDVDWDSLRPEEQRANLVRAKKAAQARMESLPKKSQERADLISQIMEMDAQIRAIRPKLKGPRNLPEFFMDVCRERLSNFQFRQLLDEAARRARESERAT